MRQTPGAGGWEEKCKALGTRNVEGQKMVNEWPQNMRDTERDTYSVAPLPHLPHLSLFLTIQPGLALIPDPWTPDQ